MLPVKLKLVCIKNILSRWLHIGCLLLICILLANSTCWLPIHLFFTSQLNVLAYLSFFTSQLNVLAYYNAAR